MIRIGGAGSTLSPRLRQGILEAEALFLTPFSRVEIAIKYQLERLTLPTSEDAFWRETVELLGATELPFTAVHAGRFATLPLIHRDPFDRMIVAQALAEDLAIATTDAVFARYGVRLLTP